MTHPEQLGQEMFYHLERHAPPLDEDYQRALELYNASTNKPLTCGVPTLDGLDKLYIYLHLNGQPEVAEQFFRDVTSGKGMSAFHDKLKAPLEMRVEQERLKQQANQN